MKHVAPPPKKKDGMYHWERSSLAQHSDDTAGYNFGIQVMRIGLSLCCKSGVTIFLGLDIRPHFQFRI